MVVTLGQQHNTGEKPTVVILYAYINRHIGTPDNNKKKKNILKTKQNIFILIYSNNSASTLIQSLGLIV